jgi:hypothetical protein
MNQNEISKVIVDAAILFPRFRVKVHGLERNFSGTGEPVPKNLSRAAE